MQAAGAVALADTPEALHTYLQAFTALPAGSPSTFLERSPHYGKQ